MNALRIGFGSRIAEDKIGRVALGIVLAVWAVSGIAAEAQESDEAEFGAVPSIEEIIVVARRREESLQKVPVAITALSSESIRKLDIRSAVDLQRLVPSLSVVGALGRNEEALTLRGLRQTGEFLGAGAGPAVVSYFAEAPVRSGGPGLYLDLRSVQVLKGPQGTLFGRNTTGGAILYEPVRPSSEFAGYARITAGDYGRLDGEAAINFPVMSDRLMVRIAGQKQTRDGFTEDVVKGIDYDNRDNYSTRIGVLFRPSSQIENYLILWASEYDENGPGTVLTQNNTMPSNPLLTPIVGLQTPLFEAQQARGIRKVALSSRSRDLSRTKGALNRTEIDISDSLSLTNIASYTRQKGERAADLDGTLLALTDSQGRTIPGTYHIDDSTLTEELQLSISALNGALDWLIGGYYERLQTEGPQTFSQILNLGFTTHQLDAPIKTKSYAAYTHVTLDLGHLSENLADANLSAGFRHTEDKYSLGFNLVGYPGVIPSHQLPAPSPTDACLIPPGALYPNCLVVASSEGDGQSWNLGLDYLVSEDVLVYGSYRRGYKSAGYNPAIGAFFGVDHAEFAFGPEQVDAFELGAKTLWSSGDLSGQLNLALHLSKYKDVQVLNEVVIFGIGTTATQNAAEATIWGLELEGFVRPHEKVTLSFGYAYTDAGYDDYLTPLGVDRSGLPFLNTPEHMLNLGLTLEHSLPGNRGDLAFLATYSWQDDAFAGFVDAGEPGAILDAYPLVNLRFEWNQVLGSRFSAAAFVNNLRDEEYIVSNSPRYESLLRVISLYGEPRMWGVSLGFEF